MKQDYFEANWSSQWHRFEDQLDQLEKARQSRPAMPGFTQAYRQICHHLALAQARQYSPYLIDRLNRLALRGHQQLYKKRSSFLQQCLHFIGYGFPQSIYREYRLVLLSCLLFFGSFLLVGVVSWAHPDFVYHIYSADQVQQFGTMYDPESKPFQDQHRTSADDFKMFGFYVKNNIGIGFQTFASGFLFGIGAVFNLLYNGIALGAIFGYLTREGHSETFYPFVIGHGAFELTGIAIAGAAGLRLGYGLLIPGRMRRRDALRKSAQQAMPLVYGTFLLLLLAAFIEAFWSSSSNLPNSIKYIAGSIFWLLVLFYLTLGVRRGTR